jgi:hypothetical protein
LKAAQLGAAGRRSSLPGASVICEDEGVIRIDVSRGKENPVVEFAPRR